MQPALVPNRKLKRPLVTEGPAKRPRVYTSSSPLCERRAPVSLLHLPSDLINIIISFVPLRPRILVLSLVCKSWASMVRASVSTLPAMSQASTNTAMSFLPRITNMTTPVAPAVTPPPRLQELHLLTSDGSLEETVASLHLSNITSLTALDSSTPNYFSTQLLLRNNASTLRNWTYRCHSSRTLPFACNFSSLLSATPFPELRELSFHFEKPMFSGDALGVSVPALLPIFGQLTSLSLRGAFAQEPAFLQALTSTPLPHLSHLGIFTLIEPTAFVVPRLLRVAPRLTSVALSLNPHYPEAVAILDQVRDRLTSLEIDGDNSALDAARAHKFTEAVQACPRLGALTLRTLTHLGGLLRQSSSITDLRVDLVVAASGFTVDLPRLSHLSLCMLFYSVRAVLELLDALISRSECLRSVEVGLRDFRRSDAKALELLLRGAECAGVERMKFTLVQTEEARKTHLRRLARQFKWLEVTIV